jgi:hypothetical protein
LTPRAQRGGSDLRKTARKIEKQASQTWRACVAAANRAGFRKISVSALSCSERGFARIAHRLYVIRVTQTNQSGR